MSSLDWGRYEPIFSKLSAVPEENLLDEDEELRIVGYETYENKRYQYVSSPNDILRKIDCIESGYTHNEKKIVAEYEYEELDRENEYWACMLYAPVVTEDKIIKVRAKIKKPYHFVCSIRFFDKELNLLRKEDIDVDCSVSDLTFAYDEETDCIYTGYMILDLKNHEVTYCSKEYKEKNWICINKNQRNEKNVYMIKGSQVYVLDMEMNVVSSHKLKGTPFYWYIGINGNVNIITCGSNVYDYVHKKNSVLRRYEIEW